METPIRTLLLAPLLAPLGACAARAPTASAPEPLAREPFVAVYDVAADTDGSVSSNDADGSVRSNGSDALATSTLSDAALRETELPEAELRPLRDLDEQRAHGHCRETDLENGSASAESPTGGAASIPASPDALDATTIRSVVRSHSDGFMGCYQLGLGRDPNLQGRVTTRFDIDPKGKISDLTIAANDPFDCAVINCIRDHFVTIQFPPPGNVVTVLYPLVFGHAD